MIKRGQTVLTVTPTASAFQPDPNYVAIFSDGNIVYTKNASGTVQQLAGGVSFSGLTETVSPTANVMANDGDNKFMKAQTIRNLPFSIPGVATDGTGDAYAILTALFAAGGNITLPAGDIRIVCPTTGDALTWVSGSRINSAGGTNGTRIHFTGSVGASTLYLVAIQGDVVANGVSIINEISTGSTSVKPVIVAEVRGSDILVSNLIIDGGILVSGGIRDRSVLGFSFNANISCNNIELNRVDITGVSFGLFQSNANTYSKNNVKIISCRFYGNFLEDISANAPNAFNSNLTIENCDVYGGRTQEMTAEHLSLGHLGIGAANISNVKIINNNIRVRDDAGRFSQCIHLEEGTANFLIQGNTITVDGQTGDIAYGAYMLDADIASITGTWTRGVDNIVTITQKNHPYFSTQLVNIRKSSNITAVPLSGFVVTVTGPDTYTLASPTSGSTSGTCAGGIKRSPSGICTGNNIIRLGGYIGTWTRSGTTATISIVNHPYKTGDNISITVSSDTVALPTSSGLTACIVLDPNTVTYTCLNAGSTSGTCTVGKIGGQGILYSEVDSQPVGLSVNNNIVRGSFGVGINWPNWLSLTYAKTNYVSLTDNIVEGAIIGYRVGQGGISVVNNKSVDCCVGVKLENAQVVDHGFRGSLTALPARTWTRSGTTVTVTWLNHPYNRSGMFIYVAATSDASAITVGSYFVTRIDANTFNLGGINAGAASGTIVCGSRAISTVRSKLVNPNVELIGEDIGSATTVFRHLFCWSSSSKLCVRADLEAIAPYSLVPSQASTSKFMRNQVYDGTGATLNTIASVGALNDQQGSLITNVALSLASGSEVRLAITTSGLSYKVHGCQNLIGTLVIDT